MSKFTFLSFYKAVMFRVLRDVSSTALALIGTDLIGFFSVDWKHILSVCLLSAIITILSCFASLPEFNYGG